LSGFKSRFVADRVNQPDIATAEEPTKRLIGVYVANLEDAYQIAIWRGIELESRKRGLGVVCFVGAHLRSPVPAETSANFAFKLATANEFDGVIVVSAAIAAALNESDLHSIFSRSTDDFPHVSVGVNVEGIASVTVDGTAALSEVVQHLIRVHDRDRIAIIAGPKGHAEAEQRFATVKSLMRKSGIRYDPALCVNGTFVQESGAQAIREIIASGVKFNAAVCMNDRMAIGALEELRRNRIRVPEDVSVVGFDAIEEGQCLTPPLTTIRQPLTEVGEKAVELLCRRLEGEAPQHMILQCEPSISESCGCLPKPWPDNKDTTLHAEFAVQRKPLVDEFTALVRRNDEERVLERLNQELRTASQESIDVPYWHALLAEVRERLSECEVLSGSGLFDRCAILISEVAARRQAERRVAAEHQFEIIRGISASLGAVFDIPGLLDRLRRGLVRLGIREGYLCLFENESPVGEHARLVFAHPANAAGSSSHRKDQRFRTAKLLPAGVSRTWRSKQWLFEPLVFQDETLGYLLLSSGLDDPVSYDSLRDQVASAVKGSVLFSQVRDHERSLEQEVAHRTEELTRSNEELIQENQRRALLEQEVVDISNRTMERIGQDLHDDLCQHLAGIAMLTSVARQALPESDAAIAESIREVEGLLSASIDRVKQIARGLMPTGFEAHGLAAAVESLVVNARKSFPGTIELRTARDFALGDTDRALQIFRIVQEALSNALKHSKAQNISVALYRGDSTPDLFAEIADSGRGMPATISTDGMGLRIMRYRAEKAGAELRVDSSERGTRIECRIPVRRRGMR